MEEIVQLAVRRSNGREHKELSQLFSAEETRFRRNAMKKRSLMIGCAAVALSLTQFVPAHAASMSFKTTLKGTNEVGVPGPKAGHGTASVTVNPAKNQICYTLKVAGFKLPAIAAHIHAGKAGKIGPVVVPFPTAPGRNGKATGCVKNVKATLIKAIDSHPSSYYVNVHTTQYPGGAVRGQ